MQRVIETDAVSRRMEQFLCGGCDDYHNCGKCLANKALRFLECESEVDAVEIIHCKECKFGSTNKTVMTENPLMRCAIFRTMTEPNGFCYKGERREGETYETKPGVQIKI